jgi:4,5-dihydroxyphthalate decarboxylase
MGSNVITFPVARRHDTKFLLDGTVRVEGYDIEFTDTGSLPWPYFANMVTKISYDIGEQALSHYLIARSMGKPLTAIPVFPSSFFPQMGVAVNRASGIREPKDLVGRRVGVAGFGYNPAVWFRWILKSHYQVDPKQIIWVEDEDDLFFNGLPYLRPNDFKIERLPHITSETIVPGGIYAGEYLQTGQIDAILLPSGGAPATPTTGPLFDDPQAHISAAVAQTRIFPINTVITLNTEVVEQHPGLPTALYAAFMKAKELYNQETSSRKERIHMGLDIDFLEHLGIFPTKYGLDANKNALTAILSHLVTEGIVSPSSTVSDFFEPVG